MELCYQRARVMSLRGSEYALTRNQKAASILHLPIVTEFADINSISAFHFHQSLECCHVAQLGVSASEPLSLEVMVERRC